MMSGDLDKKKERLTLAQKIGLITAGLFLTYTIVGFLVVPPLLKPRVEQQLTDLLGRKVTIGTIKLNPLVLSATASEMIVHEMDGRPFAGFDELYANVQLSSLFKWAGVVKEIRLSSPFAVLRLMPDGKMNIDDLIARLSQPAPPSGEEHGLPRAIVNQLEVTGGKFTVENSAVSEPIQDDIAPISFAVKNLSTLKERQGNFQFRGEGPIGGKFDLRGKIELNPPRVQGRFTTSGAQLGHHWQHLRDLVSFKITKGTVGMSTDFFAAVDDNGISARLENGMVELGDFELTDKESKTVLISLPTFAIRGIHADLGPREATIESILTADASIQSWLSADGNFAIQQMLLQDLEKLKKQLSANQPVPETAPAQPWHVTLKKMEVNNWKLAFEDRTLTQPAKMSVDDIQAVVENFSTRKGTQATVGAAMQINREGRVTVDGTAGIDPLQADMTVVTTKIALRSFQPYVDEAVSAQIASGSTSSKGQIRYRGNDAQPQIEYKGVFSIDDLEIQDRIQSDDFITLAQLKAGGIALALLPNKLSVSEVLIDRPHARVTIDKAGVINVVNAFSPAEKKEAPGEQNLLQRLVDVLIMQFKGPMPMDVGRIRLERFTGDFRDASITPTFNTHMEITDATIKGLSSAPSARADFTLNGSINRTAALTATGQINPMNARQYSKVDMLMTDFALTSVSPYAGKYIGYKIDKGALRTELKYNVKDDHVDGDNIITIDQLELGEKVASPDALNLPIKLGVTLLKDRNGRIALQVPVIGDVKDPRFDFAQAIKSALTGTINKAGSEPFAAIRDIDGFTGEALRVVHFDFGLSELQETETKKLNALASYLKEKDALILGIAGTADRQMDGAAVMVEAVQPDASDGNPEHPDDTAPEVVEDIRVDNNRLTALAQKRAKIVSIYLVEQAGIDAARIRIKPARIKPEPDGENGLAEFSLSVQSQ